MALTLIVRPIEVGTETLSTEDAHLPTAGLAH